MIQSLRIFAFYLHSQFFGIIFPVTGLRTGLIFTASRSAGSPCVRVLFYVPAFVFQKIHIRHDQLSERAEQAITPRCFLFMQPITLYTKEAPNNVQRFF
jgi:hypothetical protein